MMYLGFAMMNLSMLEANMNAGNETGNAVFAPIHHRWHMLNTDRLSRQAPDDLEKKLTEDPLRLCVCVCVQSSASSSSPTRKPSLRYI